MITSESVVSVLKYLYIICVIGTQYLLERIQRCVNGVPNYSEENVEGKVVVVTGANCGIGKSVALEFAKRRAIVVLACRNLIEGKRAQADIMRQAHITASNLVDVIELDLADLSSVRKFADTVSKKYPKVTVLVNNAGLFDQTGRMGKTKDGFERHIGVNYLGHFLLTELMLPVLKAAAPSRIVNVSATAMAFSKLNPEKLMEVEEGPFSVILPYANSKMCNSLHARVLGDKLKGTNVTTYSVCPGIVQTNFIRNIPTWAQILTYILMWPIAQYPGQGAESVVYCALAKTLAPDTGKFYRSFAENNFLNNMVDTQSISGLQLWYFSEKLVGLTTTSTTKKN